MIIIGILLAIVLLVFLVAACMVAGTVSRREEDFNDQTTD